MMGKKAATGWHDGPMFPCHYSFVLKGHSFGNWRRLMVWVPSFPSDFSLVLRANSRTSLASEKPLISVSGRLQPSLKGMRSSSVFYVSGGDNPR